MGRDDGATSGSKVMGAGKTAEQTTARKERGNSSKKNGEGGVSMFRRALGRREGW